MKEVLQQGVKETWRQVSLTHRLLCLIASVCVPLAAAQNSFRSAQPTGTIIGTVTDINDGTVPGATVALESPSLPAPERVKTGDDGFFKLSI